MSTLPPRTQHVFDVLAPLADASTGALLLTMDEMARAAGVSRQVLHTHLERLRRAGMLTDHEAVPVDGGWRRVRRLATPYNPPLQSPLTTTPIYRQTDMHAVEGELRSPSTAGLRRPEQVKDMHVTDDIEELLQSARPPRVFDARLLPPYPGQHNVPTVVVPKMPRLSGDTPADARLLVRAYKAACHARYGRRPRVDSKAAFRMQRAVLTMRAAEIVSPYAWASFRLVQWQYSERRTKPPGIDYVFSAKVIEEHATQYHRKAESYDVLHRVLVTPAHAELLELWERCRRAVASPNAGDSGEEATVRIVESILPAATYHDLVERVPAERDSMLADLYRRLAAGEWIW